MSNEELKRYYDVFADSWKFFRKYSDAQETDAYWEQIVAESAAISKKYGECKLIVSLLLASVSELERKAKGSEGR